LSEAPPASYYLKQKTIALNLVMMSTIWLATSFGFFLILSLINTFEKVYLSALTSSFSEVCGYTISGLVYEKIGIKQSFLIAFAISAFGGILILTWGLQNQSSTGFFIMFLLTKFGITCSFNLCFVANQFFFPTLFAATAIGACNFLARFASAFSYPISAMDEPTPMYLLTCFCAISAVCTVFLKTQK